MEKIWLHWKSSTMVKARSYDRTSEGHVLTVQQALKSVYAPAETHPTGYLSIDMGSFFCQEVYVWAFFHSFTAAGNISHILSPVRNLSHLSWQQGIFSGLREDLSSMNKSWKNKIPNAYLQQTTRRPKWKYWKKCWGCIYTAYAAQSSSPVAFPLSLRTYVPQGQEFWLRTLILFRTTFFLEKGKKTKYGRTY